MGGVEISTALAAVLAGLASAARGHAPMAPRWRLRAAVALDTASLATAAILAGTHPEILFATPILVVAAVSLGDWSLAVLQLRGAAGRPPPAWLVR
jgi:hypothetical protein